MDRLHFSQNAYEAPSREGYSKLAIWRRASIRLTLVRRDAAVRSYFTGPGDRYILCRFARVKGEIVLTHWEQHRASNYSGTPNPVFAR